MEIRGIKKVLSEKTECRKGIGRERLDLREGEENGT